MEWLMPRRYLLRRGNRRCGRIALTFDDGPNPAYTPKILDQLDVHSAKATFFLIGCEVERHRNLVREVVRRGHAVGNHTYSHANLAAVSPRVLREEIDRGRAVIEEATGIPVRLLRPPAGNMSLRGLTYAAQKGLTVVLWSVDSRDWAREGPETILQTLNGASVRSGDILLLHDDYPETLAALPAALINLRRCGLSFGSLGDMLADSPRGG